MIKYISLPILLIYCLIVSASYNCSWAEIPVEIIEKLDSEDVDERLDACLILGKMGDPEGIPYLKARLGDRSMLIRHSAANALARIGGNEVNGLFNEMIDSPSVERKRIGLAGLAMTGDTEAIEKAVRELDNLNWQVRWSAVYALGQWGYRPALGKLEEIAKEDPYQSGATAEYPVRKAAEEACRKIRCYIEWHNDLSDARILAVELQKPLWIYWFTDDNYYCRTMNEVVLFLPEVSDLSQNFVCVRINAEEEKGLVEEYDVSAVPCLSFISKDGVDTDKIQGLVSRRELVDRLKKILEGKGTPREWKKLSAEDPKDIASSWHLAEWYLDNNRIGEAVPLLKNIIMYDPQNKSGYADNAVFVLGYSLGAVGEYKEAIDSLETLRTKYPNFKDMDKALYCLGLDYLGVNNTGSAKLVFTELVEVYPESKTVKHANGIMEKL